MNTRRATRELPQWCRILVGVSILNIGFALSCYAEPTTTTTAEAVAFTQKSDTASTAPTFVPPEVQGVGGQWIIPEDAQEEMAVRPAPSPEPTTVAPQTKKAVAPAEQEVQKEEAAPAEKPSPRVAPPRTDTEKATREENVREEERNEENATEERVPPRPKWVTIFGKVESVKPLPKNELEVTVKTREFGRVKVIVSPFQVQRVPGKGRSVRLRGAIIREGRSVMTIRAMEMDPKDEGAMVPMPPPMSVSIGAVYWRR